MHENTSAHRLLIEYRSQPHCTMKSTCVLQHIHTSLSVHLCACSVHTLTTFINITEVTVYHIPLHKPHLYTFTHFIDHSLYIHCISLTHTTVHKLVHHCLSLYIYSYHTTRSFYSHTYVTCHWKENIPLSEHIKLL